MTPQRPTLTRVHHRRLRDLYRSAGWPIQDMIEVELLAAGQIERVRSSEGHETLRVTDAGIATLAKVFASNKAARSPHEELVQRVALEMTRGGRLAWRGLMLRVALPKALLLGEEPAPLPESPGLALDDDATPLPEPPGPRLVPGHARCVFDPPHLGGGLCGARGARDQGEPGRSAGRLEEARQARGLPGHGGGLLVCAGARRQGARDRCARRSAGRVRRDAGGRRRS